RSGADDEGPEDLVVEGLLLLVPQRPQVGQDRVDPASDGTEQGADQEPAEPGPATGPLPGRLADQSDADHLLAERAAPGAVAPAVVPELEDGREQEQHDPERDEPAVHVGDRRRAGRVGLGLGGGEGGDEHDQAGQRDQQREQAVQQQRAGPDPPGREVGRRRAVAGRGPGRLPVRALLVRGLRILPLPVRRLRVPLLPVPRLPVSLLPLRLLPVPRRPESLPPVRLLPGLPVPLPWRLRAVRLRPGAGLPVSRLPVSRRLAGLLLAIALLPRALRPVSLLPRALRPVPLLPVPLLAGWLLGVARLPG